MEAAFVKPASYCPGSFNYGDIVRAPNGRVGRVSGYARTPSSFTYVVSFDPNNLFDDGEYRPGELEYAPREEYSGPQPLRN